MQFLGTPCIIGSVIKIHTNRRKKENIRVLGFVLESPLLVFLPVKPISSHIYFWIKARINIAPTSNQIMEKQLQTLSAVRGSWQAESLDVT